MKHQGMHNRLDDLELVTRKRNKPWIIEVYHGEPEPEDTDGILVIRFPEGFVREKPNCTSP